MRKVATAVAVGFLILAGTASQAQTQTHTIKGYPVTGVNRLLSQPVFDFGGPFSLAGFSDLGAHNPNGGEALPLTPSSPANTVLASFVDPFFVAAFNVDPSTIKTEALNIPLRDVGVYINPAGKRAPLRDISRTPQMAPSRASVGGPITLGQWLQAKGTATIKCNGHSANLKLVMTGLIPRGLYDVWGVMLTPRVRPRSASAARPAPSSRTRRGRPPSRRA